MVCKKIALIILSVFTIALCAIVASADSIDGLDPSELIYLVYNNDIMDSGTSLPIGSSNNSTRKDCGCQIGLNNAYMPVGYYAIKVIHSYSCTGSWGSDVTIDFRCLYSFGRTDWSGSASFEIFSSSNNVVVEGNIITFISIYYVHVTVSNNNHPFIGPWLKVNVPSSASNCNGKWLTDCVIAYDTSDYPEFPEPEPEPEPSDDFSNVDIGLYITNDKLHDLTWTNVNNPFIKLPEALQNFHQYSSGESEDILVGGMIDNFTDVLTNNVVIQGQFTLYLCNSDFTEIPDTYLNSITVTPIICMGGEPSISGWLSVPVPSSWETSYRVVPERFLKGRVVTYSYYIVTSNDIRGDLGFIPTSLYFIVNTGLVDVPGTMQYSLLGITYNYYYRSSSSAYLPPDPNSTLLPNLADMPYYNGSQYYNSDTASDLAYLQSVFDKYNIDLQEVEDNLWDAITMGVEYDNFLDSLNYLTQALSYDDVSFSFSLPEATIPWFGSQNTLTLWSSQLIPFKTAIDSIPQQYLTIISVSILFVGISTYFSLVVLLFRRIIHGDPTIS